MENDRPAEPTRHAALRGYNWIFIAFLAIAAFFLLSEHRAHLLGALPFLLLLACPLMHLFMHHGHQGGNDAHHEGGKK
ncbi:DUF2933 domain-containing protein [Ferrigenium sp. UT5]|uniref:DUF2933 domain-containing protein n=1 Tax=Ferrigenium sp. UT5 TaxID=3242105 RepID=UPI00354E8755